MCMLAFYFALAFSFAMHTPFEKGLVNFSKQHETNKRALINFRCIDLTG